MSLTFEKTNGRAAPAPSAAGRVGRPRANPRPLERPPEEEILVVAGRLFAQKGFTATSTREIAEAAGLRQPSLFHYYPKKEKILETLVARVGEWTLEHAAQLDTLAAPASAKLYRCLYLDVYHTCSADFPGAALMYLPEVRPPSFPEFWAKEEKVTALLARFVRQGIAEGDLAPTDPALSAAALRGMGTGTLTWSWRQDDQSPERLAHHVADLQLRSLLEDPASLERVRQAARRLQV